MRIFNETKTEVIESPDMEKGYLVSNELITHHDAVIIHHDAVDGVEEVGHYETICVYPNGGKDVEWVVDRARVEPAEEYDEVVTDAYDEREGIQVYIPYTTEELDQRRVEREIGVLKAYLSETDYMAIKCSELGLSMEKEYPEAYEKRLEARKKINELEKGRA